MFVTEGQLYYFIECVFIGVLCGAAYFPLAAVGEILSAKRFKAKRAVGLIADALFAVPCCVIYGRMSLFFGFPDFRAYMPLGVALGFVAENASFNKTLAILTEKAYNKIAKSIALMLRRKHSDRKKVKTPRVRGDGYSGSVLIRSHNGSDLSTRGDGNEKKRSGTPSAGNNGITGRDRKRKRRNRSLA